MKKVVFCLPGRQFSGEFLKAWSDLIGMCIKNNIQPIMSQQYSPLLYYVRNMCLGGNVLEGVKQKPFQGKLDYDYIMWIDSDIVFKPEQFFKLIEANKDIVSGLYKMSNNTQYATVENWDDEFFKKNGSYEFLTPDMVSKKKSLFPVSYTGFGFILIKKGVFESLEYPWFRPLWVEYDINNKKVMDFTMEDVAFCKMIKEKGFDVFIDPKIIVGHEKTMIL
jgi:glycosyltransferase involved in cell wall biosynthesis